MNRSSFRLARRMTALAVSLSIAAAISGAAPRAVHAGTVTFGTPTATSEFGKGIDFTQPVTGLSGAKRVEICIDYPDALGPAVTEVAATGGTLRYRIDTSQGQLSPNTALVARWRVTFNDGTQQVGPDVKVTYIDDRFRWHTKTGNLVTLHWLKGDDAFATRVLAIGEKGIEKAASLLGAKETKPVDFFVYADQQSFYDALGPATRDNVGGQAHSDIRTLFALITPDQVDDSWVSTVVPHELTHIVFDDVVGNPFSAPPHWLNEGIAVYLTTGYDASARASVRGAARGGTLMPLAGLSGQFPTLGDRFSLAYDESVSAVDYLVRTYGESALVKLVQTYSKGVSDDEAFNAAIGIGLAAFDDAWLASNGVKAPTRYGPQPAPIGPVPPGWTGEGASPAPGATGQPTSSAEPVQPSVTASPSDMPRIFAIALLVGLALALFVAAFVLHRRSSRGPAT